MIRFYTVALFLVLLLGNDRAYSQGENNNWCFGRFAGLDFNSTPPSFFQHNMQVIEGCASVSDAAGNLLFYSSGNTVWDRNGNTMPNGTGMHGNGPLVSPGSTMLGSSMMGVAVAKSPSNPGQYYLFTTNAVDESISNVYYSVVDMSLNGGLGDVVPAQRDILLAGDVMEGVRILENKDCGYWIILHKKTGSNYLAFRLDNAGVHTTPVISTGFTSDNTLWGNMGYIDYSYQHNLLARGLDTIELLSFNQATGAFTFTGFLSLPSRANGIQFSPDASQLYVSSNAKLFQLHTALLPNISAVQSSIQVIDSGLAFGMRKGPDDKIYLLRTLDQRISIIHNPNATGAACNYVRNGLVVPAALSSFYVEFGQDLATIIPADTLRQVHDTLVCQLDSVTLRAPVQRPSYYWSNGSTTRAAVFGEDGTYWVSSTEGCALYIDSFHLRFVRFDTRLGNDTAICPGDVLLLDATTAGGSYRWQNGSTAATFPVSGKGTYSVTVEVASCRQQDTILVDVIAPSLHIAEADTTLCAGTAFTLHATAFPEGSYQWSNGATGPVTVADSPGTYIVTAQTICGTLRDSVHIDTKHCNCTAFAPNAFSPNGDGHNDRFVIELHCNDVRDYRQSIYNRYGQKVYETMNQGGSWDGTFNGHACDLGTYFYLIRYKTGGEEIEKKGDLTLVR